MTNGQQQHLPTDHEYLDLKQAAIICSVSEERFGKWIDKGAVPIIEAKGRRLIHSHDLVQHLVRHNIPIPDRLLQGNSKKILFVLTDESIPHKVTIEIIWALYALRKETAYIFDFVRFDRNIELKIITFHPDKIVLLQDNAGDGKPARQLRNLTNGVPPVYTFVADNIVELKQFLRE
ncbi:MAG: hypothetical protein FWG62_10260 [Proteobacteria bacterium]|nr:hypothetical protein [Pseudomonadota bacterium]